VFLNPLNKYLIIIFIRYLYEAMEYNEDWSEEGINKR
jgi:hypothetical protein